jgi:putative ABC transport system ATP-binding protein
MSVGKLAQYRATRVGFIFQQFHLLAHQTALQNVMLPMAVNGAPTADRETRAMKALTQVGLERRATHRPGELSGGEQQRVAIARALVTEPKLLLADEPTGNLDSARSNEIMSFMQQLNRDQGITIVWVTHELELAREFATSVARFADGVVVERTTAATA